MTLQPLTFKTAQILLWHKIMKVQPSNFKTTQILQLTTLSLVSGLLLTACSFNVSTATLENIQVCSQLGADETCDSDNAQFTQDIPELIATADLKHAPEGTQILVEWNYLGGEAGEATPIDRVSLEVEDDTNLITSSLSTPESGWPSGDYEVVFSLDTDNSQPLHKTFSILAQ